MLFRSYEIRHQLECIYSLLERLAAVVLPKGSEREQIALRLFVHTPKAMPDRCYELADMWIAERDRQREKQAEQGRAE